MPQNKKEFRHNSLQDAESIQKILKSIGDGLASGKLNFSDEENSITLDPLGLLNVKVSASQDTTKHRFAIRVSWQVDDNSTKTDPKSLKIKT